MIRFTPSPLLLNLIFQGRLISVKSRQTAEAAFDFITPFLKRIYRYSTAIYIFSGILLIAVGILILTNNLIWLHVQFRVKLNWEFDDE